MDMMLKGKEVILHGDCAATRIPSGEEVVLKKGEAYTITQALGGSVTVRDSGGLYRIGITELHHLGTEVARAVTKAPAQDPAAEASDGEIEESAVWDALRQCFDPEIPVNIVDLGLVYDLRIHQMEERDCHIEVKMTLTATGCGMGPTIAADAKEKILSLRGVRSANVEIVWDPQWTPHMISPEGRKILGLD